MTMAWRMSSYIFGLLRDYIPPVRHKYCRAPVNEVVFVINFGSSILNGVALSSYERI